jgi:hypothetical protein
MPWYKSGTVSVTQNSNAVIGTGTAFIANSRVGDAFRGPDGGWYEVTNIASDTALSISPNYQGMTNAAGVYALAPMQGYVKDSADALRALVNTYGTKLAALGTTGNYDILPVNKGGTGGTTQAAAQTALDLIPQSSLIDTTNNRVLKTGAWGLGIPVNATDANNCTSSGAVYRVTSPFTNCPTANAYSISTMIYDNEVSQLAFQEGSTAIAVFFRKRQGASTWGAWGRVAMSGADGIVPVNVGGTGATSMGAGAVGTVSQTSGVPTGKVVETGSNTNGKYTKFASGLLICEGAVADFLMAANSITACPTATFPSAFIDTSYVVIADGTPSTSYDTYGFIAPNAKATTFFNKMYKNGASAQWIVLGRYVAVGRWF